MQVVMFQLPQTEHTKFNLATYIYYISSFCFVCCCFFYVCTANGVSFFIIFSCLFACALLYSMLFTFNPCGWFHVHRPDGHSPDTSGLGKWPLKPGVLLHVNKMRGLNVSTMSVTAAPAFKTTSVAKTGHRFMNKRNRNKVYARLEKLRDLLGFGDQDAMPFGVYRGSGGGKAFYGGPASGKSLLKFYEG